jgi:hypothetical protein
VERTKATTMRPSGPVDAPMTLRWRVMTAAFLAAAAIVVVGCGSQGGTTLDNGHGGNFGTSGAGTLTWKDSGTMHTALFPSAARVKSSVSDMVQVTGGDSTGAAVAFGVGETPPLVAGSYTCGDRGAGRRVVSISYGFGGASSVIPTCAIEITSLGETTGTRIIGAFTATLPFDNGTTRIITDGKFDVALTVSSL